MKRFFHDISWVQILAGALAAVTAFLLSSRIGIAGSVIGVAVGSIVSAFASQLYQNVLDESSKKLHDTVGSSDDGSDGADGSGAAGGSDGNGTAADDQETRTIVGLAGAINAAEADAAAIAGDKAGSAAKPDASTIETGVQTELVNGLSSSQKPKDVTSVMDPAVTKDASTDSTSILTQGNGGQPLAAAPSGKGTAKGTPATSPRVVGSGNAVHPKVGQHAKPQRRKVSRNVIIVSIVSALITVGITAGIIYALTGGQGTDKVLRPSESTSTVQTTPSDESTSSGSGSGNEDNQDQGNGTSTQNPSSSSTSTSISTSTPSSSSSSSSSSSDPTASPSTSTATPTQSPTTTSPSSSSTSSSSNSEASSKSSSTPSDGSNVAAE
ncbi:MAG: hypothetical protein ABF545_05685 [Bifidobacterium psychraerophilum]|uniref:hypothetical protein n=1 Tax=Bifidobacterium psychraerophilum TaxID=218140 RepID=UPI0039E7AEB2